MANENVANMGPEQIKQKMGEIKNQIAEVDKKMDELKKESCALKEQLTNLQVSCPHINNTSLINEFFQDHTLLCKNCGYSRYI